MVILDREMEEEIIIGDYITLKVVEIRGDKVRIGITAPTNVNIERGENYRNAKLIHAQAIKLEESGKSSSAYDLISKSNNKYINNLSYDTLNNLSEGLGDLKKSLEAKLNPDE